jgi:DNA segregation ATPase FtsK/SpoIIIE-like protein
MENMGYRLVLKARTAGAAQAAGVPNAVNLPAQAGLGYFRKSLDEIIRFQAEFMWRDYKRGVSLDDDARPLTHSIDYIRPQLFTNAFTPLEVSHGGVGTNGEASPSGLDGEVNGQGNGDRPAEREVAEEDTGVRTPRVGTVIIDQLRRIDFEPYRLWQPPLDVPVAIDDLVNRSLGRPWQENYGSARDLVFPIGVIDRPFKHDQPPWTVNTSGPGSNVLILGAGGAGKTTALQTLICSAALTHTPQQVQFYCLAYSGTSLTTVAGLPHVGSVVGPTDPYSVRRTIAEVLGLVRERKRTFLEYDVPSMEVFRRRKFGGEAGRVPDDGFGDVYLVIDNYRALAEENEVLIEQVNVIINQGPSFGVHVVVTADRESELRPPVRSGFGSRVELRLAAVEDAKLVRSRFAKDVPVKPGRGMVAVNYVRLESDPQSGLHTLIARPALDITPNSVFESESVVEAVRQFAVGEARPVRRLPLRSGPGARDRRQRPSPGRRRRRYRVRDLRVGPAAGLLELRRECAPDGDGPARVWPHHHAGHHHVRDRPGLRTGSQQRPSDVPSVGAGVAGRPSPPAAHHPGLGLRAEVRLQPRRRLRDDGRARSGVEPA